MVKHFQRRLKRRCANTNLARRYPRLRPSFASNNGFTSRSISLTRSPTRRVGASVCVCVGGGGEGGGGGGGGSKAEAGKHRAKDGLKQKQRQAGGLREKKERGGQTDRQRKNSKVALQQDCSLGSVKICLITSPC